ncbi:tRNA (adenosine(37)-N6)-dimethylallyltransferase MiaA [Parablautia muri]|uniref:tRNA dimethylallyltransferase n=1 Tax=Parablautia muri TaxID=2320879 RepID=A0A9X5BCZ6_9FIRM|nr:tRNA (adenosine(37)-N6)-dimethylallyltransferase MiaA [Parablautia muri]NBJ91417.1 tRNA (adenosine(37)-N6)-dimethylallyltransferase MiaA [Parablautia muri]
MMDQKGKMIVLTGPTAVGKTALSIALAKEIGGEIISADSMQVYKYMDIGSAKITKDEMQGVKHYLIDVLEPSEEFNVYRFQQMAKEAVKEIYQKGHIPIVVGGTGFYIQALLYDIDFSTEEDHNAFRIELERLAAEKGSAYLHAQLEEVDSVSAKEIHPNNQKRIIRALEFYQLNGEKISDHNQKERQKEAAYDFSYFVLTDDRKRLYQRIDERVDAMLEKGLLEEVRHLKEMGYQRNMVSMQGLGYKELLSYLSGECTLDEAIYLIKRSTRRFAKRQLTWFRRERDVIWLERARFDNNLQNILNFILKNIKI